MTTVHEDLTRGESVKVGSERSFGLVFAGFFALVGIFQAVGKSGWWIAWIVTAATILVLAFARPDVFRSANLIWFRFGMLLNRIVSPVVLGILFFGVITPIGLLMRLFGRRPCQLSLERRAGRSYWMERSKLEENTGARNFENQF